MKYNFIFLVIIMICLIFLSCPTDDGENGNGDPTPILTPIPTDGPEITPVPDPVIIDDFSGHVINNPPGGDWASGCETSYAGGDNRGVTIQDTPGSNALILMLDVLGGIDTYGDGETGYSYAQIEFTAGATGTISFDYTHIGEIDWPNPEGELQFWENFDLADIASPQIAPDWINTTVQTTMTTHSHAVTAGDYTLTWRIEKDWASGAEDWVFIDNIVFTYD